MDALAYDLKGLGERDRQGSRATQSNRARILSQMAADLAHFKMVSARSIKPKHIEFLVAKWKADGLSHGTMKNRMACLRWWCHMAGKDGLMKPDNEDYGILPREPGSSRAWQLTREQLDKVTCPRMKASLLLCQEFGLRKEESLKFIVAWADRGDHIELKPSWTKGGRGRVIPVVSDYQRRVLDRIRELVGTGSLIPPDRNYKQHMKAFENATYAAGIRNVHGLRHGYAVRRYRALTGWEPPFTGGLRPASMPAGQYRRDREARFILTGELGHGRLEITDKYLGG